MSYQRVLPRDLFNEAKLLKCMGRLALLIHDQVAPEGVVIVEDHYQSGFEIDLNPYTGELSIINMVVLIHEIPVEFSTPYNSRENYPLLAEYESESVSVFTESGEFDEEFIRLVHHIGETK